MESNKFNKYKVVADIIEKALNTLEKLCIPNTKINELSKFADEYILAELNKTYKNLKKGLAMPTCISVNNIVCHYVPTNDDEYQLYEFNYQNGGFDFGMTTGWTSEERNNVGSWFKKFMGGDGLRNSSI